MRTKKIRRTKRFAWRSFKEFSLKKLRQQIGEWVAWDNIGLIRQHNDLQMYAPGLVKRVTNRRQITIYVPSMIVGGVDRKVKPEELFFAP